MSPGSNLRNSISFCLFKSAEKYLWRNFTLNVSQEISCPSASIWRRVNSHQFSASFTNM
ncbi:hypothetical protein Lalb_Chr12g0208251 [Lupinus albus]|uniref:Uncharacterized protein n=1 Tax=Lupinus albus TaxID=3870 RepID=A0A6A4PP02_LUPAL|nr:hypothetical protein Lalb_Chr12g0208251 [Lupinus albus]